MTLPLNQTQTSENLVQFFQKYATELLKRQNPEIIAALRRRNIDTDKIQPLETAYTISFKLSNVIYLASIKDQALQQIDAIAYFIRDIYTGRLAQRSTLFHLYEVEIILDKNIEMGIWEVIIAVPTLVMYTRVLDL